MKITPTNPDGITSVVPLTSGLEVTDLLMDSACQSPKFYATMLTWEDLQQEYDYAVQFNTLPPLETQV